jgi:putative hydrolase of the HAD superfamily
LNLSSIRGVIFDLGSTLIDFDGDEDLVFPESLAAIADHLLARSLPLDRNEFIHRFDLALRGYHEQRNDDYVERSTYAILFDVLKNLVDPMPEESLLREALAAMYAVSEAYWKTKPSAHSVLDQLMTSGYRLGLLSNAGDEANVQRLIDDAGIRKYFDPIFISAALGIRKPDPRPFLRMIELWSIPAETSVMVGDLLEADILGARRSGMHSIWLHDGSEPAPGSPQPDFIAEELDEIPDLILRINQKGK